MSCPRCQSEVPQGARFCAFCGIVLRTCSKCARLYGDDDAQFCGDCGIPLAVPAGRGVLPGAAPRPVTRPLEPIAAAAAAVLAGDAPTSSKASPPPMPGASAPVAGPATASRAPTPPEKTPVAEATPVADPPTAEAPADATPRFDEHNLDPSIYGYLYELGGKPRQYPLRRGDTKLGAGNNNDIIIDRAAVSWNHALFICRNGRVLLQDSASTNGTFVNGKRLRSPRALRHGDTVRFGDVEFRVWIQAPFRNHE